MKVSYVLLNKTGKARKVPPGQAWQWTHHIEDASQLAYLLDKLKKDIRANRLALANLVVERQPFDSLAPGEAAFTYKGPITYDAGIRPHRIFHVHPDQMPLPTASKRSSQTGEKSGRSQLSQHL